MSLIWFLIIGAVAGWLAGKVMKGKKGYGLLGNIVVGCIGALIGGFLLRLLRISLSLGIRHGGLITSLITAFLGALLLLVIINWLKKK
jgi:uncharacterized membrane protein YeaQ/YmgE (transglycosylase-associated protein family)